jgi:hypothetical protein
MTLKVSAQDLMQRCREGTASLRVWILLKPPPALLEIVMREIPTRPGRATQATLRNSPPRYSVTVSLDVAFTFHLGFPLNLNDRDYRVPIIGSGLNK